MKTLLAVIVTLIVAAAPTAAQGRARLTSGRMKHQIFVALRHDSFWESRYDAGRVHGPVFKSCYVFRRGLGTCWYEMGIASRWACGWGDVRMFRRRDGIWFKTRWYWWWGRCQMGE